MKKASSSSSSKPSSFSTSHKPHSSSSRRSRWESSSSAAAAAAAPDPTPPRPSSIPAPTPNPNPNPPTKDNNPNPNPASSSNPAAGGPPPQPQPTYGFQNLDRRTIVLADGTVRSYFALPLDYPMGPEMGFGFDRFSPDRFREPPPLRDFGGPPRDFWLDGPRGLPERGEPSMKRRFPEEDEFGNWNRHQSSHFGNPNRDFDRRRHEDDARGAKMGRFEGYGEDLMRAGAGNVGVVRDEVDPQALKRAFLRLVKVINEDADKKKNCLADGKNGPLQCIVCGRASNEFPDVHALIMHAYTSQNPDLQVDHLGLHKALCVLMGWNYRKAPENSKGYQSFSADDASANREDLIVWPPTVIIHNTNTGKRKDGRMEGLGNREMDMKVKDLGFGGGKCKSLYGKEGHLGITVVKYTNTQAGLKEAERLAEYFEKENHGRKGWARAQASQSGGDEEKNLAFVKVDPVSGEKKRILYGYLATAFDLELVDLDIKKKAVIKSKREFDSE